MTEQLSIVAHLTARPGKVEDAKSFLLSLVPKTRAEPGCVDYDMHQDNVDPAKFTFYENWKDRGEWDKHMAMPHLVEFLRRKEELFTSDPEVHLMTMLSDPARR
jgi:quinol monooxygenase YgiN